ncbi:MAG: ABC transporter, permease protein [Candidatus Magasanikbacteria bacterium GW2011_GWA2_45_39]|uniref:ABC transporter, permease protein n=1 Tax=Candidatus Magasanikbacteria bacterium GW2011_GWA2_45_39 TaxID=1619041 RepID=A0A0G1QGX5_9BACT|nr:MAG: ABC transporter, permease protein [Candidatus Magasanikbacteria bacterium GW2011_GWA2_45_39]
MTIIDILQETYIALSTNKVRSFLTVLGIVIGISSVIAMVAIGQGAQGSIQASIQSIGSNLILVMPGAQRGPGFQVSAGRGSARTLVQGDADAIAKEITLAKAVAPELSGRYQVTSRGKNTNTSVIGTTSAYLGVRNIEIDQGTFIADQHVQSLSKVAVLGPTARDDLFGEGVDAVGQTIRIKNVEFKVIGVAKAKGGTGFGSQDDMIFIPLSSAQRFLAGDAYVTTINVEAADVGAMASIQEQITTLLLDRHHISDPQLADFNTLNQADIVATASSVTQTFTILLAAVAGISLLVGGIGIMNMMLTNVTERTKEIGLRKAIGAKRRDINFQFLVEAIALTFLGGLIGIMLGWLISFGITYFGIIQTRVSVSSVFLAFGVSAGIGIVFGYYPARRAARLNPIVALRYE